MARRFENVTSGMPLDSERGIEARCRDRWSHTSRQCQSFVFASGLGFHLRGREHPLEPSAGCCAPRGFVSADIRLCARDAHPQTLKHAHFGGSAGDQMKRVDRACLTDAIHAPDALFEPHRIPRQLEIHDNPAVVVEIQPFARRIGGEKHAAFPECADAQRDALRAKAHREESLRLARRASRTCTNVSRYSVKTMAGSAIRRSRRASAASFDSRPTASAAARATRDNSSRS